MARARHERRDVAPRLILAFAGGLAVSLIVVVGGLGLAYDTTPSWPLTGTEWSGNTQTPALQRQPDIDIADFTAREDTKLEQLGWIDRSAGVARIPIEDAMGMVARDGLPDFGTEDAREAGCPLLESSAPRAPQARDCRDGETGERP